MPRKTIKVVVRTRPTGNFAQDELIIEPEKSAISVIPQDEHEDSVLNNKSNNFRFIFHHVLHNASQETTFETMARDVVQGCMDGTNGTIMSYGQTGSGKTFTMMGDTQNYQHRGVAPRCLSHIFAEVNARIETQFTVSCSYMEIYNERIFDLLGDLSAREARTEFTIAEERGGRGIIVRGLTEVPVANEREALNLLFSGELGRTTAQHKLNKRSNRSHSIFTVYISQRSRSGVSERVVMSKLNLVDLAGSERLKKTLDSGHGAPLDSTLKKESMCINQSLTYLEQCVVALARKNVSHVPYRQTKLTNVLKDSIGGNCNTLMFACIWGESAHLEETVSTLRLASRMMRVQNETTTIEVADPVTMVRKQEQQIKELKQELLMHDALADRQGVVYDPYTPEQQADIRKMLDRYLTCTEEQEGDVLDFRSVRQMIEICRQFKGMWREQQEHTRELVTAASAGVEGLGDTTRDPTLHRTMTGGLDQTADFGDMVGEQVGLGGFGLGTAPDHARPITSETPFRPMSTAGRGGLDTSMGGEGKDAGGAVGFQTLHAEAKDGPASLGVDANDRHQALAVFKSGPGRAANQRLADTKSRLRELKNRARACATSINEFKAQIDQIGGDIEEKKNRRMAMHKDDDMQDVVDEEEFRMMKRQRESKKLYRAAYEDLAAIRADIESATKDADACKFGLLADFERWLGSNGGGGGDRGGSAGRSERPSMGDPMLGSPLDTVGVGATGSMDSAGRSFGRPPSSADDKLDDQEKFDKLELERVASQDPDSLSFFQAQKTRRANATQNSVALRAMHKNKRNR